MVPALRGSAAAPPHAVALVRQTAMCFTHACLCATLRAEHRLHSTVRSPLQRATAAANCAGRSVVPKR